MFRVEVMSRKDASEYSRYVQEEDTVIISITDVAKPANFFIKSKENRIKDILELKFDDEDEEDYKRLPAGHNKPYTIITKEQAKQIADFVERYKDEVDMLIVHCEAGVSRSSGCAAAILKYLYNDDTQIFDNPYYCPNMTVYRKVLNALYGVE